VAITTINGASGSDLTTLQGTELADSFALIANSLYIDALEGADTVTAANAVDKITAAAGAGGDTLTFSGALTNANLDLGDGNDTASFQDFAGTLLGGTGNDVVDINRSTEKSTLKGASGSDKFTFDTTLDSSLIWGNGDDDTVTVTGATTGSTIYGGQQQDNISVAAATNTKLRGDKGNDTITLSGVLTNVVVQGNADADQINVSSASATTSTVFGGKGSDDINITGAAAILIRGDDDGDDIDVTANGKHTISGGAGIDSINSSSTKASKIFGGKGNDVIVVTGAVSSGNHVIKGDIGNDNITGADDAESIDGGEGKDTITGGGGQDTIYGRAGADSIDVTGGTAAKLNIQAGTDDDKIKLLAANLNSDDTIKGDGGTDTLQIDDGNGLTDVAYRGVSSIETVDFADISGTGTATFAAYAQAAGITKVDATDATTTGFIIDASAYTSAVGITLTSGKNDDDSTLKGGAGADTFNTGVDGVTAMTGGGGADTFNIQGAQTDSTSTISDLGNGTDIVTLAANTGQPVTATVVANYAATVATKNQSVVGNAIITGSGFDVNMSAVTTGTSGFTINGNATAATLQGSALNDSITGNSGADSLVGNAGNDTIYGAAGIDTISLGAGTNFLNLNVTLVATNRDAVTGFVSGTDKAMLDVDGSTDGTAAGASAVVTTVANVTEVGNGIAYGLNALGATDAKDLYILSGGNETNADLSASTDGTELLKYVATAGAAASGMTVKATSNLFYVAAFDGGNTYLYEKIISATTTADAGDFALIATLTGTSSVAAADFVMTT
jgi:Ca2+-binding RTX toxin-like protein